MKNDENAAMLPRASLVNCSRRHVLLGLGAAFGSATGFLGVEGINDVMAETTFRRWVQEFRKIALKEGIRAQVFDAAFAGVEMPDAQVLQKAAWQAEFKDEAWCYFDNRIDERAVEQGQVQAQKLKKQLELIEKRFGVSRNILLAIWSMETNYGAALAREANLHDAIAALATLGYGDKKRAKFGKQQLLAALKILQNGDIKRQDMKSSWAGAMGHTQFIPTSYLRYGVDMDGDGRRDIWHSVVDALASSANLLKQNGWKMGRGWGYEVTLPKGKFPSGALSIEEWQKLGLRRANGQAFPDVKERAILKLPDGRQGPIFLVLDNFSCLKRYNNADRYAFAVGLLADRIGGYRGLVRDWSRPFEPVSAKERLEMQQHLTRLGFYDGQIDGKIGRGSLKAIEDFQRKNNMIVDGYPSRIVLSALRNRR